MTRQLVNYELETMLKDVGVTSFEVYHPGRYRERDKKNYEYPQPASAVIMSRFSTMTFPIYDATALPTPP
jgi:hypothetical protein